MLIYIKGRYQKNPKANKGIREIINIGTTGTKTTFILALNIVIYIPAEILPALTYFHLSLCFAVKTKIDFEVF